MTTSNSKWVIAMWHWLSPWSQPPKFCKIPSTSYNSLIMYERVRVEIIFLLITTWTRLTNKHVIFFFITKNLKIMSFSRDTLLSDSYYGVVNDVTVFTTSDWWLDSFVFASGFIHDYVLRYRNKTCKHLISLSSFFVHKWAHKFSDMAILTSSVFTRVWYHTYHNIVPYKQQSWPHECVIQEEKFVV